MPSVHDIRCPGGPIEFDITKPLVVTIAAPASGVNVTLMPTTGGTFSGNVAVTGGVTATGAIQGATLRVTSTSDFDDNVNMDVSLQVTRFITQLGGLATVASATSITPPARMFFVSGTTTVATINVPAVMDTDSGSITIIPTGIFTINTAGNVALGVTTVVNKALTLVYDVTTNKWHPSY